MDKPSLSPSDISALIDYLLKSKDPATVGLRKILRGKKESSGGFPLQNLDFEEFFVQGKSKEPFSKEERAIIELERRVNDLQASIERIQKRVARPASKSHMKRVCGKDCKKGKRPLMKRRRPNMKRRSMRLQKRISTFLAEIESSKKSIYANAHAILLDLACGLARKIIQNEVTLNPDIILDVIKKSIVVYSRP